MGWQEEGAFVDQQDTQPLVTIARAVAAIKFFGTIGAEHAGTDNDHVEWRNAVVLGANFVLNLLPRIADVPSEHIVAEGRLLKAVRCGITGRNELWQRHDGPPHCLAVDHSA